MTQETPEKPSVRRTVLDTLRQHPDGMSDTCLVALAHARTTASASLIRTTVMRLQREGAIYHARDNWRVTRL